MNPRADRNMFARLSCLVAVSLSVSCAPTPEVLPGEAPGLSIDLEEDAVWAGRSFSGAYSNDTAMEVIERLDEAVSAMSGGKNARARALLRSSRNTLSKLQAEKGDDLLVLEVGIEMMNTAPAGLDEIKRIRREAARSFRSGEIPRAREQLLQLVSEVRINTVSISLRGWADSIRRAEELASSERYQEACEVLAEGYAAREEQQEIRALPLIQAGHALAAARGSKDPAYARAMLEAARFQLSRARALGYTGKGSCYDEMRKAVRDAGRHSPPAASAP